MRVLHVISSVDPRAGGTTTALAGMALAQKEAGLEVGILATYPADFDDSAVKQLREGGVAVRLIGPSSGRFSRHPQIVPSLREEVARADVIHIHALWEEVQHQAAVVARRLGKPYVLSPHGMLDPWSLAQSKWVKKIYMAWRLRKDLKKAAALHFTAGAERDLVAPLKLGRPAIVEPLGLDLREFEGVSDELGKDFRRTYDLGDQPLVLFLSRVHPKKGLDFLLPAFAKASGASRAKLVIAGPVQEGYEPAVAGMIASAGLGDRVMLTGMLRGRERLGAFVAADLFVLPSRQENFGMVVIESLACGTPVILSNQVNIWKEVVEGAVGAAVKLETGALALELARWLGDGGLRHAAAGRARKFVAERYNWETIGPRWMEWYGRVIVGTGL